VGPLGQAISPPFFDLITLTPKHYTKVSGHSFAKSEYKQNSGTAAALNPFAGMAALC
jgi:hypothetical protein